METISKDALLVAPRQELIDIILQLQSHQQAMEFDLAWLRREVFGPKSERFIHKDDMQTMLELGVVTTEDQQKAQQSIPAHTRSSKTSSSPKDGAGHGRGTMPTHLPIDEVVIEPEGDLSGMVRIGEEVSWHYEMLPGSLRVKKTVRPKYARPDNSGVNIAALPPLPVDKGNAGPGLMAQVVVDKYVYHIPLDRQRKKFKNEYNVEFSESWLCDLVKNTAFWMTPLDLAYRSALIKSTYLQADETPMPVMVKDKRGRTHRGYFWVYQDPISRIVIFDYRESRSAKGPLDFLRDFKGILQVDAYVGYDQVVNRPGLTRAACMDHVRRRFDKALDYDQARATYALDAMRAWYEVERQAKDDKVSLEDRFSRRTASTVPSMREFKKWLDAQLAAVLPKSPIGTAITYALNQWPHFEPFMTDMRVELSNIRTENAIRPVAIGRNNYMFCGSHEGARRAAMIYSLVSIAKVHGHDPLTYIKDLLTRLPAATNQQIDQFLMPAWKPAVEKIPAAPPVP